LYAYGAGHGKADPRLLPSAVIPILALQRRRPGRPSGV
jgi:hypothetical protein